MWNSPNRSCCQVWSSPRQFHAEKILIKSVQHGKLHTCVVQRETLLSNFRGLGRVYSSQTARTSNGATVSALIKRVEPWTMKRDIVRFLQQCATPTQ